MLRRPDISATIITLNEAENLPRCLASLDWVDEIVVVDCGSIDDTREIAKEAGAKVLENPWVGFGQQKNYAMHHAKHNWVLNLDADEVVSTELRESLEQFLSTVSDKPDVGGAMFPRRAKYLGRWILHGGWYPNMILRLARKDMARWSEPAVHETLVVSGKVESLRGDLLHFTFRDVADQVRTNARYAVEGAKVAESRGERSSILKILCKPVGKFIETYFVKRGFLDGFPGFVISVNASHSLFMKYVELYCAQNSRYR